MRDCSQSTVHPDQQILVELVWQSTEAIQVIPLLYRVSAGTVYVSLHQREVVRQRVELRPVAE